MIPIQRFIKEISKRLDNNKEHELNELWDSLSSCPILLQSGIRKYKACGKPCQVNKLTCFQHASKHMCSYDNCLRKCKTEEKTCEYHQSEEKKREEAQRIYPSVRWCDPYFLIKGTQVIIDIDHQVIIGYKKDQQCISEETEEIKELSRLYQLRFMSLVEL